MISANTIRPVTTAYYPEANQRPRKNDNAVESLKKDVKEDQTPQRKKSFSQINNFLQDKKEHQSQFQSIDSMALHGLLGRMGAMDSQLDDEKGNLIDVYT